HLLFTRLCIESILATTRGVAFELLVIDNASADGTVEYLRQLSSRRPEVRVIFNDRNRGFAAATNQGLVAARGEVLVLLNNDTIPPGPWLARITKHLDDRSIGLLGPVTNRACNEAQIDADYRTYGE